MSAKLLIFRSRFARCPNSRIRQRGQFMGCRCLAEYPVEIVGDGRNWSGAVLTSDANLGPLPKDDRTSYAPPPVSS